MEGGRKADLAAAYHKEYQAFIQKLQKFHESRGSLFRRAPTFSGRPIDLYVLYKTVTSLGGFGKVTDDRRWPDVAKCFDLPWRCTNVCYALRQHYIRYLESYEKTNYLGEDNDYGASDARAHNLQSLHGPLPGMLPSSTGEVDHSLLFGPLGEPRISNFNKLVFSLMSGLQNEVDFALNICTLLSNVTNSIFNLAKSPNIVDLMLAHVGIFSKDEFRVLHEEWYDSNASQRDFRKAWHEFLGSDGDCHLLETMLPGLRCGQRDDAASPFVPDLRVEEHRIYQVAVILYNFSFERINALFLADSSSCLKFLLVCSACKLSAVKRIAIETVDNLAGDIILANCESQDAQVFMQILHQLLTSMDRFQRAKGMMMLSKLCSSEANKAVINEGLSRESYVVMIDALIIPDIQLILSSLDVLYALTSLGQATADAIAGVHGSVEILVSLISVHAESFGNEAIAGFRIVENKNSISAQKAQQEKSLKATHATGSSETHPGLLSSPKAPTIGSPEQNQAAVRDRHPVPAVAESGGYKTHALVNAPGMTGVAPVRLGAGHKMEAATENGRHLRETKLNGTAHVSTSAEPVLPPSPHLPSLTQEQLSSSAAYVLLQPAKDPRDAISPAIPFPEQRGNGEPTTSHTQVTHTGQTGPSSKLPPQQHQQQVTLLGQQQHVVLQCYAVLEQIKKEIQQHFLQFHFHRQQIESIQTQLQQVMQQHQQNNTTAALPANIMSEVQSKVKTHHGQMQAHYNKLQQLQIVSQQIQQKIGQEQEQLLKASSSATTGLASTSVITTTAIATHGTGVMRQQPMPTVPRTEGCASAQQQLPHVTLGASSVLASGVLRQGIPMVTPASHAATALPGQRASSAVQNGFVHNINGGIAPEEMTTAKMDPSVPNCPLTSTKRPLADTDRPAEGEVTRTPKVSRPSEGPSANATPVNGIVPSVIARMGGSPTGTAREACAPVTPLSNEAVPARNKLTPKPTTSHLMCSWKQCRRVFLLPTEFLHHLVSAHAPGDGQAFACELAHCSGSRTLMSRTSMTNHFKQIHCAAVTSTDSTEKKLTLPDLFFPKLKTFKHEDESPVTRSVRLTASLILRNIARHSPVGKRLLSCYQDRLATAAMSPCEASTALASCLFEMSRRTTTTQDVAVTPDTVVTATAPLTSVQPIT